MAFRFSNETTTPEVLWETARGWLRFVFVNDWATKVIALIVTSVLWYGVAGNRTPATRVEKARLSVQLPSETEVGNELPQTVEIELTGDKNRVSRLNREDLLVSVDLSDYEPRDYVVQLKPDTVNIELPSGIQLTEIEPSFIRLQLEPRIERAIEVRPTFTGKLPEGYELYSAVAAPATVRVRGARSQIETIGTVPTEPINLDGLTQSVTRSQVTVNLFDNQKVTVLDALVGITLNIGETRIEREFQNVAVRQVNGELTAPERASVVLYGAYPVIEALRAEDLAIELQMTENEAVVPQLVLPPDLQGKVETRRIKPSSFTITRRN